MQNATGKPILDKIFKFSQINLILYSFVATIGVLFFLYFLFYLFLTGNKLYLILGILEGVIGGIAVYTLFNMTDKK